MKKYVLAAAAAVVLAGPAAAADLIVDPVIVNDYVAPGHDWNGFYAGVMGGYGSGSVVFSDPAGVIASETNNIAGGMLGLTAGANGHWDMFVLGVEGDIAWANINGSATVAGPATISSNVGWLGTLRARAGVAVDSALLYVTAGLAAGQVSHSTSGGTSFAATHTGWTAGAGVEFAVTEDLSLKAEYAYTDLGTVNDGGALNPGTPIDIHPTFHAVKAGINFHF